MKVELIKASGRTLCRGANCPQDPKYIIPARYGRGRIIKDTTCASITMDSAGGYNTSYLCRDCLENFHNQVREILNPKLWIFS